MAIIWHWLRDNAKGGSGSGNFGHAGRKGKKGGSASMSSALPNLANEGNSKKQNYSQQIQQTLNNSLTKGNIDTLKDLRKVKADFVSSGLPQSDMLDLMMEVVVVEEKIIANEVKVVKNEIDTYLTNDSVVKEMGGALSIINDVIDEKKGIHHDLDKELNILKNDLLQTYNSKIIESLPDGKIINDVDFDGFAILDAETSRDILIDVSQGKEIQKKSAQFYERTGDWIVNGYLRTGKLPDNTSVVSKKLELGKPKITVGGTGDWNDHVKKSIESKIKQLDESMTDSLKTDTILTRFVGKGHPIYEAISGKKDLLGTVYNEAGYSSTSANVYFNFGYNNVKIKIRAKAGTKGLAFNSNYNLVHSWEREFLLPRNSAFKVIGVELNGDVIVDIIDNGVHP